jgi:CRISPR-associated protein Cas2
VGVLPARVRDEVWLRIRSTAGSGRAIMIHSTRGEQRLSFRVHNHKWAVQDFDGLVLIQRPSGDALVEEPQAVKVPQGWSNAARRRRR